MGFKVDRAKNQSLPLSAQHRPCSSLPWFSIELYSVKTVSIHVLSLAKGLRC